MLLPTSCLLLTTYCWNAGGFRVEETGRQHFVPGATAPDGSSAECRGGVLYTYGQVVGVGQREPSPRSSSSSATQAHDDEFDSYESGPE